eukprot:CAMPEP_0174827896 /NCGR_PEP_ID=MMETSP1114-20130205/995_1 /TAXON_ID=312471 /ORGANISM="Neobodo designis, Strain CCAP 1951/1" /LENGTH=412 /DNA_ID=CAMNT_0016061579 /DNA_START=55 /DNA_END=1289 /DNA_ORIENTATION=+
MEGLTDKMDIPASAEREAWMLAKQHFQKPVFNRTEVEQSRILTLISRIGLLESLPFDQRVSLSKAFKFRTAAADEVLLNVDGEAISPGVYVGQQFSVIVHGCVKHTFQSATGRITRELYKEDAIGMPCVVASVPPGSKYTAVEATELLYLDMDQYASHLSFLDAREIANRIKFFKTQLIVPVLASWTDAQFEELARSVYPMRYQSRTVSVREGEKADSVFFLVHGKMKVVREIDFSATHGEPCAKLLELATLTPGEYYGEAAFLRVNVDESRKPKRRDRDFRSLLDDDSDGESEFELRLLNPNVEPLPRQATVYAHTPAEVLVLPRLKFIALFQGSALVRVQEYAKGYPSAAEVRTHYQRQQKWADFKDRVMSDVVTGTTTDAASQAAAASASRKQAAASGAAASGKAGSKG